MSASDVEFWVDKITQFLKVFANAPVNTALILHNGVVEIRKTEEGRLLITVKTVTESFVPSYDREWEEVIETCWERLKEAGVRFLHYKAEVGVEVLRDPTSAGSDRIWDLSKKYS